MRATSLHEASAFTIVVLIVSIGVAHAQPSEQCRQIKNRKERHECYLRPDAAKAAVKPRAKPSKMDSDLDRLKRENDLMTKKLRSICKGC